MYKKQPMRYLVKGSSDEAQEILKLMLKINPSKRASASQLLQDPYFAKINLKQDIQRLIKMNNQTASQAQNKLSESQQNSLTVKSGSKNTES